MLEHLNDKTPSIEEMLQLLQERDRLPCIWFLLSRVGCDKAVLSLQKHGLQKHKRGVLPTEKRLLVAQAVTKLR